jgi:predicted short-subunit dehydrogenase-like oxidoreductase (DUF2520 family)
MGTALGLALKAAGFQIAIVVTKRPSHARRAAKAIGGNTLGLSAEQLNRLNATQLKRLGDSSLVLIATPDDAIARVAAQLATIFKSESREPRHSRPIAIHTSGALSSEALRPLQSAGFATGSLHPLVSISDSRSGANSFAHAFFSVEGDPRAVRFAKSVVRDFDGQSFTIKSRHKALYHAAAVMASPHLVALFDMAQEMLARCGVSPHRARQVLLPLMESTIANLSKQSSAAALTGTFKRGDAATARKHLEALESARLAEALQTYVLLGQRSLALARTVAADGSRLEEIALMLSQVAKKTHS